MNSLRNKLLAWLLGAVSVVGIGGAWFSYRNALSEANAFFDYHLRETALLLRDQAYGFAPAPGLPREVPQYDFVVQVWTLDGVRVYLSRPHTSLPGLTTLGLSTVDTRDGRWRVFGVEAGDRVIQVAQPMGVREQRAAHLALRTIVPFVLLVPALGLLILWVVGRSVRPVREYAGQLRARKPDDLEPLGVGGLPDEVRPMAVALNELLVRLKESISREREFIAAAAHELRTPLTALHLQVQSLEDAASADERAEAIRRLGAGVARANRLVEQLLALAREERGGMREQRPVGLAELVREVVGDMVPLADRRRIDLGLVRADAARILGEEEALRVLVRNLLDNAIRYSPEGGRVDVAITAAPGTKHVELSVTDNGPGIPPEDRERVFERFYRLPGTAQPGSGLGLALVRSVARHHAANVRLDSGPDGRGLQVTVTFPAIPES